MKILIDTQFEFEAWLVRNEDLSCGQFVELIVACLPIGAVV